MKELVTSDPWQEVDAAAVDTSRPYLVKVSAGTLPIFFFDPYYYEHIGGMLKGAQRFLRSLDERYPQRHHDTLINICTDGELYGHWEAFGERFLAYVLTRGCADRGIHVTNYGLQPDTLIAEL